MGRPEFDVTPDQGGWAVGTFDQLRVLGSHMWEALPPGYRLSDAVIQPVLVVDDVSLNQFFEEDEQLQELRMRDDAEMAKVMINLGSIWYKYQVFQGLIHFFPDEDTPELRLQTTTKIRTSYEQMIPENGQEGWVLTPEFILVHRFARVMIGVIERNDEDGFLRQFLQDFPEFGDMLVGEDQKWLEEMESDTDDGMLMSV
jgi:hypothetical protein